MQINVAVQHGGHVTFLSGPGHPLHEHLAMLLAWCGPEGPGLAFGLFLAGLAGGPLHCGPMCGPFVLGQAADRLAAVPAVRLCEMARLRSGLLLPYHLGRLLTYSGLGAVAGMFGALPQTGRLGGLLLLGGAALFLLQALGRIAPALPQLPFARPPAAWITGLGLMTARFDRASFSGGLLRGLALGFLPCGLLYAALAVAASAGSAGGAALAMAGFAAGTVPILAAIGIAGGAAGRRWRGLTLRVAPVVMVLNAAVLTVTALNALALR